VQGIRLKVDGGRFKAPGAGLKALDAKFTAQGTGYKVEGRKREDLEAGRVYLV
jgi:hypothetical protein